MPARMPRERPGRFPAFVLGMFIALLLAEAMLRAFAGPRLFYRPHEMLSTFDEETGLPLFKKNRTVEMTMPHGDLAALALDAGVVGHVERTVRFTTDSLGFRNESDYHGQPYLLVGDSFVVGSGSDQKDMLGEVLKSAYDIESYSVAQVVGPMEYGSYIKLFSRRSGADGRVLLFLFEGNDFPEERPDDGRERMRAVARPLSALFLYRFLYGTATRIALNMTGSERVGVLPVGGVPLGIYRPYREVSEREHYTAPPGLAEGLEEVKDSIAALFFIPTKYRVYRSLSDNPPGGPLPSKQWEYVRMLGRRFGVPAVDLTEPLQESSKKLLRQGGGFTYWEDDTHWNRRGVEAAAGVVAQTVRTLEASRPFSRLPYAPGPPPGAVHGPGR